ncbi:MAG: winged helix-turn-helix transcriptional regulator [Thermoplasmatota archaeon]
MSGCCPYRTAFDLLSKRHAMTILWLLQERRPLRFTQLKMELSVNPVTLTQRLCELERAGVLQRTEFRETPPRVEYDLTEKGMDLLPLIEQACAWAKRWDASPIRA